MATALSLLLIIAHSDQIFRHTISPCAGAGDVDPTLATRLRNLTVGLTKLSCIQGSLRPRLMLATETVFSLPYTSFSRSLLQFKHADFACEPRRRRNNGPMLDSSGIHACDSTEQPLDTVYAIATTCRPTHTPPPLSADVYLPLALAHPPSSHSLHFRARFLRSALKSFSFTWIPFFPRNVQVATRPTAFSVFLPSYSWSYSFQLPEEKAHCLLEC
jgi:hypothetical protein